jgi:hypothetical protein
LSPSLFCFAILIIISQLLPTHLLPPPPGIRDSPDQAEHYQILGPSVGGFIFDSALGWSESKEVFVLYINRRNDLGQKVGYCKILI